MRKLWWLGLLLNGCAPDNLFYVDSKFTAEERSDIRVAATDWEIAVGTRIDLEFDAEMHGNVDEPRREIIRATKFSTVLWNHNGGKYTIVGFRDHGTFGEHIVILADKVLETVGEANYRAYFRNTVRHELGHHFGIHHNDSEPSIMNTNVPLNGECIDSFAVDLYCQVTDGCDRQKLRGCRGS